MDNPSEYKPRYVSVHSVPIEVEDRYPDSAKREALFEAENELELDRNAGYELDADRVTNSHILAVLNLATYYLVRSATANDDVTLGDLDDGGEQTERHAEQYKETYEEIIEKISEAGREGEPGSYIGATGRTGTIGSVNTGSRHNLRSVRAAEPVHNDYVTD